MGRSYSSGVAVDKSNFSPDVAVRVAPVPQDDAARSRSSSAHVHVSSQVDAHLRALGFWSGTRPRRWRGATASALRCFLRAMRPAAQCFRRIRLPCALALLSAPLWLGKRRRCPNRCAELRTRSLRPRARAWLAVWPSSRRRFCLCCAETMLGSTEPASLRRLQRLSGTRFGTDHRSFKNSGENSRVFHLGLCSVFHPAESVITRGLQAYKQK